MQNSKIILVKRFEKVDKHFTVLQEYKILIDQLIEENNIFDASIFSELKAEKGRY